jgi:hypothetical protein
MIYELVTGDRKARGGFRSLNWNFAQCREILNV